VDEREAGGGFDRLLLAFLPEDDEAASEGLLARLVTESVCSQCLRW
jgi:hypothetical protein